MKFYLKLFLILLLSCGTVSAQQQGKATDLPMFSVIGNFVGSHNEVEKNFDVQELEFAFQHYLYPSVKADIFAALHKEESGERVFELEEGYVTFSDFFGVLFSDYDSNLGIGAIVGKKLINIGKANQLHFDTRKFVDRPLAIQQFFDGSEGLSGEGATFSYLLPLPFFSQLEIGGWTVDEHAHEEDEHDEEEEEPGPFPGHSRQRQR